MKKIILIGLLLSGAALASVSYAQVSNQDSFQSSWSPWDTIHCLGLECGNDILNDGQLSDSIDYFNLDYLADINPGWSSYHHNDPKDIKICTSVCYKHYKESSDACREEAPRDPTLYGAVSGTPDEAALSVCMKSVRNTLFECIPACNSN